MLRGMMRMGIGCVGAIVMDRGIGYALKFQRIWMFPWGYKSS